MPRILTYPVIRGIPRGRLSKASCWTGRAFQITESRLDRVARPLVSSPRTIPSTCVPCAGSAFEVQTRCSVTQRAIARETVWTCSVQPRWSIWLDINYGPRRTRRRVPRPWRNWRRPCWDEIITRPSLETLS